MSIDWELNKKLSYINRVIDNIFGINVQAVSNKHKTETVLFYQLVV